MAAHRLQRERLTLELLDLAHLDDATFGLDQEDQAEMHARHRARVVVEQGDEAGTRPRGTADLLGPLAAQAANHGVLALAVTGVDVPADPEGVEVMKTLLARSAPAAGEQVRIVVGMMDDAVRNDLLQLGIVLDLGPRPVFGGRVDGPEHALEAARNQAVPGAIRKDGRSRHAENVLRLVRTASPRHDGTRTSHASRHRAHSFTRDA